MAYASYDVTFAPKVNVCVEAKNPLSLTEKEMDSLLEKARLKVKVQKEDLIINDNLLRVELYSKSAHEAPLKVPQVKFPDPNALMLEAHENLNALRNNGYIPFASPCPSSTEKEIKHFIEMAIWNIECAMNRAKSLYK